jgi:hypothetical protein
LYNCTLGEDYPFPIVDTEESGKKATDIIWKLRKTEEARHAGKGYYPNTFQGNKAKINTIC